MRYQVAVGTEAPLELVMSKAASVWARLFHLKVKQINLNSAVQLARNFETTKNAEKHKGFGREISHHPGFHFHPDGERQERNLNSLFRHFPCLCVSLRSLWFPKEIQLPFLGLIVFTFPRRLPRQEARQASFPSAAPRRNRRAFVRPPAATPRPTAP